MCVCIFAAPFVYKIRFFADVAANRVLLMSPKYHLRIDLSFKVIADSAAAKFNKKRRILDVKIKKV
jgi:hypothetical protein